MITDVVPELREYWTFKDELAVLDGIVYKGSKVFIPISLKLDILERLNFSQQGVSATIRRARQIVYWPHMADDIKTHTKIVSPVDWMILLNRKKQCTIISCPIRYGLKPEWICSATKGKII